MDHNKMEEKGDEVKENQMIETEEENNNNSEKEVNTDDEKKEEDIVENAEKEVEEEVKKTTLDEEDLEEVIIKVEKIEFMEKEEKKPEEEIVEQKDTEIEEEPVAEEKQQNDEKVETEASEVDESSQDKVDDTPIESIKENEQPKEEECVFKLNWMVLKNAETEKVVWASTEDYFEILFEEKEAHIPIRAVKAKKIIRSLNFSTSKEIKGFRIEQKIAFKNKCLEEWAFEYGDIMANTTHTWHSLFTAAPEHDLMPFEELSGNTVVETAFFNSDGLFNMSTVKLYFT